MQRHHPEFADRPPDVPWSLMYTMRNRVAHGYFAVDFELVWKTIQHDLPGLYQLIRRALEQL
ncbi:HepT-like ribonuclease domain-containing protein [Methylomicrobium sp. RS1]|uniref:HepT-like ribonuclease domain-containing protein n=1 Tax=Candidatus Methylomicrobium oryzae TaxID=2802053 RepID=UPI003017038E